MQDTLIPFLGREDLLEKGYPLQYSWASLMAQLVKNLQCGRPGFDPWVGKIPWRGDKLLTPVFLGFPGGSAGKESAVWETWVWSLSWGDSLEKGTATHSSILAWRIPRSVYSSWGCKDSDTTERLSLSHFYEGLLYFLLCFSSKLTQLLGNNFFTYNFV